MGEAANTTMVDAARAVLDANQREQWTVPSPKLYPHQWLWDSCFIAIGLRHYDTARAKQELLSLLRGQWQNGMIPHITLTPNDEHWANADFWQSGRSKYAPNTPTSGLTQPPVLATAALLVSEKLDGANQRIFLKQMFPALLAYHSWLYTDRDPGQTGLVALIHPWECGLDNTPYWDMALHHFSPLWVGAFLKLGFGKFINNYRKDTQAVPQKQRLTTVEALKFAALAFNLRKHGYDASLCLKHNRFAVEDVSYNSILAAANKDLGKIADIIAEPIPTDLAFRFQTTNKALELLWDSNDGLYYSRSFHNKEPLRVATVASLLPLYSGVISKERADVLVRHLINKQSFWPAFPVPSVATNDSHYTSDRYWQGPTWINMNWLLYHGLKNYGYDELAESLRQTVFRLVNNSSFHEYFSALDGSGYGIDQFSWTAALSIDLFYTGAGATNGGTRSGVFTNNQPSNQTTNTQ